VSEGRVLKSLAANLLSLAFGLLFGILISEVVVRIAGFAPFNSEPDATIGYRHRPHAKFRFSGEGGSQGRFNAHGWRDVEHAIDKPAGTTRILFVGDSYTAAFQVALDSTYFRRLERMLNANAPAGHRYEVIAMGQDGNSTTAEYLTWRTWGAQFHPDVVALLFIPNDMADNWRPLAFEQARPFFVEEGDSLRLDRSFADDPAFRRGTSFQWLKTHSALWPLVRKAYANARGLGRPTSPQMLAAEGGYYRTWNYDARVTPDTIAAFRLTRRILERFAREVHADGSRFVVFAAGFAPAEDFRLLADARADSTFDPDKTPRWLAGVGAAAGFDVVPLSPRFRAASDSLRRPLWFGPHGRYGHWNETGHQVAATAMNDWLQTEFQPVRP